MIMQASCHAMIISTRVEGEISALSWRVMARPFDHFSLHRITVGWARTKVILSPAQQPTATITKLLNLILFAQTDFVTKHCSCTNEQQPSACGLTAGSCTASTKSRWISKITLYFSVNFGVLTHSSPRVSNRLSPYSEIPGIPYEERVWLP